MESILIMLNEPNFEYDIHSLVKAFFPGHEVKVAARSWEHGAKAASQGRERGGKASQSREHGRKAEPELLLTVEYLRGAVWNALRNVAEGSWQDADGDDAQNEDISPDSIRISLNGEEQITVAAHFADRVGTKNILKRALYRVLSEHTGQELPWGSLTGIRPIRIPLGFLTQGKGEAWIHDHMRDTYLVSPEKIRLSIEIAKREQKILERVDYQKGYSLYIGIPFCPTTCLYCSFPSYPLDQWASRTDEYLAALEQEIDFTADVFRGRKLNTVYIGGGTPTTLTPGQLGRLLGKLGRSFDLSYLEELTVEAGRPDSVTEDKLQVMRAHGVSRISINPQTMKQETLRLIGRRHTVGQTEESFHLARSLGFSNINMDLIVGLPEESLEDVRHTMERLQGLMPDSVTVHSLALKRAARLSMFREDYSGLRMENTAETIGLTADYAERMGLFPYYLYRQKNMAGNFENVGYAKEGREGLYNVLMIEEVQDIVACGAGSISKRVYPGGRIERSENVKDVGQYMDRIGEMIERKRVLYGDSRE